MTCTFGMPLPVLVCFFPSIPGSLSSGHQSFGLLDFRDGFAITTHGEEKRWFRGEDSGVPQLFGEEVEAHVVIPVALLGVANQLLPPAAKLIQVVGRKSWRKLVRNEVWNARRDSWQQFSGRTSQSSVGFDFLEKAITGTLTCNART